MLIRMAKSEDAEQLAELNRAYNESEVPHQEIAGRLADPSCREKTAVAEMDNRLVGFACLQIYSSWCYPAPWAEITELYVMPFYRRRGAARDLVTFLENLAVSEGVSEIILVTGEQNFAAQSLARRCGFEVQSRFSCSKQLNPATHEN